MSIFNLPGRRPVTVLDEGCDRCGAAARVRVAKDIVTDLTEFAGAPHAVEVKNLDLVLCGYDFDRYAAALRAGRWEIRDDRR